MNKINIYTTRSIDCLSLVITMVIFLSVSFIINNFSRVSLESINFSEQVPNREDIQKNALVQIENKNVNSINEEKQYNWYIEIKSINLKAPIEESTETEVLAHSVGHFIDTSLKEGNVGLAAHNRGYEVNYFENLKSVKIGDEIIYQYNDFKKKYEIDTIEIIEDTNWSYLEQTDDNKITLITCVENEPNYRRCVQATQKE